MSTAPAIPANAQAPADGAPRPLRRAEVALLAGSAAAVIALLGWAGARHDAEFAPPPASAEHYNLLVDGFRAGQLDLHRAIPPGLAELRDPYDPVANAPFRAPPVGLHDASYFRGKLFLYFGPVPALLLFWPCRALTGFYLSQRAAVVAFTELGFLVSAGLLVALWRRYFRDVGAAVVASAIVALGLATGAPAMLQRPSFYETAISGGAALVGLALVAGWLALHHPERRAAWLAAASLCFGLALGCRPSLLFGAVSLVLLAAPTAGAARAQAWRPLVAALGPIALLGSGLLLYNHLRFGDPFEFGQRYQLAGDRQAEVVHFSPRYLGFNLRLYFLESMRWTQAFPFVDEPPVPPLPSGHADVVEFPVAILTNLPLAWLALAVPLAVGRRETEARRRLGRFLVAVAALAATSVAVIGLFYTTSIRYEFEFLPPLVWLAAVGVLSLERAWAARPARRWLARGVWTALLVGSVGCSLLGAASRYAENCYGAACLYLRAGQLPEAVAHFERALRFKPLFPRAHADLGIALTRAGRLPAAIEQLREASRLDPASTAIRVNLATVWAMSGRLPEAIQEYGEALRLDPQNVDARVNLGTALLDSGRPAEAAAQFRDALRLRPDDAGARAGLREAELASPAAIAAP